MKQTIVSKALVFHEAYHGKIEVKSKVPLCNKQDLSLAYTPGVAEPCRVITRNSEEIYRYTNKWNQVAVISDGSAVLGLGNIGGKASLPVMEGKAILFKEFGGLDAFPICLNSQDPLETIATIKNISVSFGGVNLEDFKAPECFFIEEQLKQKCDIPVFHDDQHGTAVVVLAALYNALKLTGKKADHIKIVVNGIGSAGTAICKLLHSSGFEQIVACDRYGALYSGCPNMTPAQQELTQLLNLGMKAGQLEEVIHGADVFIGVSTSGILTREMVTTMAKESIIFALANPTPEVDPEVACSGGARIVATGRSDYPNQVNNLLVFPGIFRGALDVRASTINEEMEMAAAGALAKMVSEAELSEGIIIPSVFNRLVMPRIAAAVAEAAQCSGVASIKTTYQDELEFAQRIASSINAENR
jgi:malate dehydrogenase (oxaloacetate-decarboxylating)